MNVEELLKNGRVPKTDIDINMSNLIDFGLFNLQTLSPITYYLIGVGVVYLLMRYALKDGEKYRFRK